MINVIPSDTLDGSLDVETELSPTELEECDSKQLTPTSRNQLLYLFPKIKSIPVGTFFFLTIVSIIPAILFILGFTKMGYGIETYYYISEHLEEHTLILASGVAAFSLLVCLSDMSYWKTPCGKLIRNISTSIIALGSLTTLMFLSGEFPIAPICVFIVIVPIWLVFIKHIFYQDMEIRSYVRWLGGPLFFVALGVLFSWIIWSFWDEENEWNPVTRINEAERAGCKPDFTDYPNCRKAEGSTEVCFGINDKVNNMTFPEGCKDSCVGVFDECLNTFVVWVGPLLVSLGLLFLTFFTTFVRDSQSVESDMLHFAQLWVLLLFIMWVAASLSGSGVGVSTALAALTLGSFAASIVLLALITTKTERNESLNSIISNITIKYGSYFDIIRGLLIVTGAPIFLAYLPISFLNQCIRRLDLFPWTPRTKKWYKSQKNNPNVITPKAKVGSYFTDKTEMQLNEISSWNTSKVCIYAIYWGIVFMTMNVVVARFTILFLSWLIETCMDMSLGVVTGIMVGVGLIMFLLPPVPGVPIYLTLGIVIIAIGRDSMGIEWSIAYASGVSLALKLLACTIQQKFFGGLLKKYVAVRQFVGINSTVVRSMKVILGEKGMGIAKVSILVGGPDWPTSVLCGIMDLPLLPVLFGTLPVFLLILPTLLSGSFTFMSSLKVDDKLEYPWAGTATAIFIAITGLVQFGAMMSAAFYLQKAGISHKDELEAMPIDEEVKAAEDKGEEIRKAYKEVINWSALPHIPKVMLCLSLISITTSCYMVQLLQDDCFAKYELSYTIEDNLDGDWKNFVLPLGQLAILLFFLSIMLLWCFTLWAKRKALAIISPENDQENLRSMNESGIS